MSGSSAIEWTDATWNPVVGCTHVSAGCDNCYAARETAGRLAHLPAYTGLATRAEGEPARFTGEVRALPERLDHPLHWTRPRRVFVNSMGDLFHPGALELRHLDRFGDDTSFLAEVVAVMVRADRHTFQVLTKRPKAMAAKLADPWFRHEVNVLLRRDRHPGLHSGGPWPEHLWFGTSIEDDRYAYRANWLRLAPAAVRFLSLEPLLGPLPSLDLAGIGWVIVGGESGPKARPMHPEWATDVRDRCLEAGVPFFFKQWGEWAPVHRSEAGSAAPVLLAPDGSMDGPRLSVPVYRVGKKAAGRELDGATWDGMPERVPA